MTAYFNENNREAADWLRELIKAGEIAPGDVDERSIEDVRPDELAGYTQCHFFAGIGGWSLALRQAGWPDDKPVWTGSCPCQPFSAAGKGAGFDDERHLWPAFHWLIEQCRPAAIFGEQVASKATGPWFDLVQADLEALGYAFGLVPFPAASIGAPHIRDRAYWVAHNQAIRRDSGTGLRNSWQAKQRRVLDANSGGTGRVGHSISAGLEGLGRRHSGAPGQRAGAVRSVAETGESGGLAHNNSNGRDQGRQSVTTTGNDGLIGDGAAGGLADTALGGPGEQRGALESGEIRHTDSGGDSLDRPGPTNGFWRAADWLFCRDGKWRPVEPGTFPLVDGIPRGVVQGGDISFPTGEARAQRLKGYGNAIVPYQAAIFIKSTEAMS